MKQKMISRRALLVHACGVPIAGTALFLGACADKQQSTSCADPKQLTDSENGLRASLQYADQAADAGKSCSGCAFFHSVANSDACGTCEILMGPVSAKGHCTSWSAKV